MLTLFPALIAAVSLWGLLADPATITAQIAGLVNALPGEVAAISGRQLTQVAGADAGALSGALVVSILLALWSASAGMVGLMEGCNAAYDEVDERPFVRKRLLALAFTVGGLVFQIECFEPLWRTSPPRRGLASRQAGAGRSGQVRRSSVVLTSPVRPCRPRAG